MISELGQENFKKNKFNFKVATRLSILLLTGLMIGILFIFASNRKNFAVSKFIRAAVSINWYSLTQQLGTFDFEINPTSPPTPPKTLSFKPSVPTGRTYCIETAGQFQQTCKYCIDDEDPEPCDDASGFYVKQGSGGVGGTCGGTVISWAQKIAAALPQGDGQMRDKLSSTFTSCDYTTQTYTSGYVSTYFVIDSYNLAGFHEITKAAHTNATAMLNWWSSALTTGYKFIDYSIINHQSILQHDLTGYVMFIRVPSGVHAGIVNSVEVDAHGNGIISILQSGSRFWLDRFEIVGWNIINTPLHQTRIDSVAGFGGR